MSREDLHKPQNILECFKSLFEHHNVELGKLTYRSGVIYQNGKPSVRVRVHDDHYTFEAFQPRRVIPTEQL